MNTLKELCTAKCEDYKILGQEACHNCPSDEQPKSLQERVESLERAVYQLALLQGVSMPQRSLQEDIEEIGQ